MKILFVTERFPWPLEDGGNLRTYHVLKALCQLHDVTLLSHAPRDQAELARQELKKLCCVQTVAKPGKLSVVGGILLRPWRWTQSLFVLKNWSEPLFLESQKLVTQNHFDAVHFNHLDTAVFLARANYPSSVFDSHNCISKMANHLSEKRSARWMRLVYRRESKALARAEATVCQRANAVLACSDNDQTSFLKLAPTSNVHVVPNGVDTKRIDQSDSTRTSRSNQGFRESCSRARWTTPPTLRVSNGFVKTFCRLFNNTNRMFWCKSSAEIRASESADFMTCDILLMGRKVSHLTIRLE